MDLGITDVQARQDWPNLTVQSFVETSPVDQFYNCAAHAADDDTTVWWPSRQRMFGRSQFRYHWPSGVPRTLTVASFKSAYATLGYTDADNPNLEDGIEKVAIYALNDVPKHVARQLGTGRWTSKLGELKDIDHATLENLEGNLYGYPVAFMGRPRVR